MRAAGWDTLQGQEWAGVRYGAGPEKGARGATPQPRCCSQCPLPAGDAWPHLAEAEVPLGHHFLKRAVGRGRPLSPSLRRGEEQGEEQEGARGGHGAAEPRAGKRRGRARPGGHGVTAHEVKGHRAGLGLRGASLRAAGGGGGGSVPHGAAGRGDAALTAHTRRLRPRGLGDPGPRSDGRGLNTGGAVRPRGAGLGPEGRGDRERSRRIRLAVPGVESGAAGGRAPPPRGRPERLLEPGRKCGAVKPEVRGGEAGAG